jgi:hypothetical protein
VSAQLQAILPSSVAVGRRTTIVVLGVGTSFDGTTTVAAGANVTIHTTQVVTPSALRVELTADVAATLGARDVVVTTGTQVLTLTGGLTLAPGATGTVTAGALAQGGAATLRIEVTSGKRFAPSVSGSNIVPLNTTVAGAGFTLVGPIRWINDSTIDITALISPVISTMASPTMTITFDGGATEVVTLANVAATTPIPLPTTSTAGTLGTIRGAVYEYTPTAAPIRITATVTTTGTPSWTASTRIFDAAGTLLQTGTSSAGQFVAAVAPLYIVVNDSTGGNPNGTFNITSVESPVAMNSVCSAPTALTIGTPLTGETIGNGGLAPAGCLATATGPTRYYTVTVPAGDGVTVRVTPTVSFNANIRVIDSCSATACQNAADNITFSSATAEVVTVRNTTAAAAPFVIAVGSAAGTSAGTFTVTATRQTYLTATLTAACEDMTAATAITLGGADDSSSTNQALAIPFTHFGTAMTSFSASSNGLMQLFAAASGTVTTTGINTALPGTTANLIAPYWDDFVGASSSILSTTTVGTAPNRTQVIQWRDVGFYIGSTTVPSTDRMTFQVKLFETTNVVEFHYCTLTVGSEGAARLGGASATVGIMGLASTDTAAGIYANFGGATTQGSGWRFTPSP